MRAVPEAIDVQCSHWQLNRVVVSCVFLASDHSREHQPRIIIPGSLPIHESSHPSTPYSLIH